MSSQSSCRAVNLRDFPQKMNGRVQETKMRDRWMTLRIPWKAQDTGSLKGKYKQNWHRYIDSEIEIYKTREMRASKAIETKGTGDTCLMNLYEWISEKKKRSDAKKKNISDELQKIGRYEELWSAKSWRDTTYTSIELLFIDWEFRAVKVEKLFIILIRSHESKLAVRLDMRIKRSNKVNFSRLLVAWIMYQIENLVKARTEQYLSKIKHSIRLFTDLL